MSHPRYQRLVKALRLEQPDDIVPWYGGCLSNAHHITGRPVITNDDFARADSRAKLEQLIGQAADDLIQVAETLDYSLIMVFAPFDGAAHLDLVARLRRRVDGRFMIGSWVGGGLLTIPEGHVLESFCYRLCDDPAGVHAEARGLLDCANAWGRRCLDAGSELLILANDIAFNPGPFLSPAHFAEFIQPCLNEHVACLKSAGAWVVFHSDGNLTPILEPIVASGIHGLNPIDPMAGMDIAQVKRQYGRRVALFGNVQCDLVHRGPLPAIRESARYCLESAKAGGGLVYVTSSEVFADTPWENYLEVKIARERWGRYDA